MQREGLPREQANMLHDGNSAVLHDNRQNVLRQELVRSEHAAMLSRKRRSVLRPRCQHVLRHHDVQVRRVLRLQRNEVLQVEPGVRERKVRRV